MCYLIKLIILFANYEIIPLPCADTLPVVGGLASYRDSESCAGKGPTKPERSRMSRQKKISTTVLQSWGFCVGPTSCKKSASYRK